MISAAARFVVVAETRKLVDRLGDGFRLPVEVVRFGWRDTRRRLAALLPDAELRAGDDGEPYLTDEGHYILDCVLDEGADPDALDGELKLVPGVVEHGLFLGMAERALLGQPDGGVEELTAAHSPALADRAAPAAAAVAGRARQQAHLAREVLRPRDR